jgi:hypothetical protein
MMKIRHVETVFLGYYDPFFFLSQSRKVAKKNKKKAWRLCGFARDMFFLME